MTYKITGPALISFSGGRTSGYMLHEILKAHDGQLPADVIVTFANTGKEREETLRFVQACSDHWNVPIVWLERAAEGGFSVVNHNSASRRGEPFKALIDKKGYLPNAVTRFCTVELKVRVMRDFAQSLGWERWRNIIGLRYDEGHRVLKALARNDEGKERFKAAMPLAKAKVTKRHVEEFWKAQSFDLGLQPHEGNCDLCFLKARKKLEAIVRADPESAQWWIEQEGNVGAQFVTEYPYSTILRDVRAQGDMFAGWVDDGEEHDAECGLICEP